MATSTLLSNPKVQIGTTLAGIADVSDQCTAAVLTVTSAPLEDTAFGSTSRTYVAGLFENELTLTMYMSYAASETYALLAPLVGVQSFVKVNPTSAADGATNPGFVLSNTFLSALPVINASLGDLVTVDITFQGGTYSADVTP